MDFVGDYKDLYGRTAVTHEDSYNDFVAKSYIPEIKIYSNQNIKWQMAWIAEYFLYLANEANYAELANRSLEPNNMENKYPGFY